MSALPKFTIKELLEAGVHYGHKTMRWNPRMAPYLFGSRNGVHIIDLQQTAPMLHRALSVVYEVVKNNGRVLFVGTKRQASEIIAGEANRCGQYYVNHRWLGGMLTNWQTVSKSIKTLRDIQEQLSGDMIGLTKKEVLGLSRQQEKLERSLGGIMDMGGKPDLLFVVDTNRESLAMAEAKKLGIPVIAVVDSNSNPEGVDFPIPGNDDASRAIELYCRLIADTVISGIEKGMAASGVDLGASQKLPASAKSKASKTESKKDDKKEEAPKKQAAKKSDAKEEKPAKKTAAKKDDDAKADKKEAS